MAANTTWSLSSARRASGAYLPEPRDLFAELGHVYQLLAALRRSSAFNDVCLGILLKMQSPTVVRSMEMVDP